MKRHIYALCLSLTGLLLYTSCLKSDTTEVTYYNDTAITAFSLTAANRYVHTTSSSGADSVYKVSVSKFPKFTIDQYQRKIYNTDSLAADCDLGHMLITVSSKNSGVVGIKSMTSDSLRAYSSSDSVDFSQPREFWVYANDGSGYRTYEVTVNKHQAPSGQLLWERMEATDYPVDSRKALVSERAAAAGMQAYIGAGMKEAYAFSQDGQLMVSLDEGETWEAEDLDDDAALLPTEGFAFASWPFSVNDSTDYQLLVGASPESSEACTVWRKLVEYAANSEQNRWTYMPVESYNRYYLPKTTDLSLVYYKGHVLAFSTDGLVYESRDQGITWKTRSGFTYPDETYSYLVEATADDDGSLWLLNKENGEVWRATLIE